MEHSKKQEQIGVLGPPGTHSEAAARYLMKATGSDWDFVEYEEIHEVIRAVQEEKINAALVPVENSLEGSVNITLDMLARSEDIKVTRELVWPVHNAIMSKCAAKDVKRIYSHPQPISQCWRYLETNCPHAEIIKVSSTAKAAQMAAADPLDIGAAAICTRLGGALNGLNLIADNIEDNKNNRTRFFELRRSKDTAGKEDGPADRVLMICQIDGAKAGILLDVLSEFAERGINMTRIESRPARTTLGTYIFFFDLDTDKGQEVLRAAEESVRKKSIWLKNMGAFPVLTAVEGATDQW